jgi:hypothetical protein
VNSMNNSRCPNVMAEMRDVNKLLRGMWLQNQCLHSMFATAIRIHRHVERNVRRGVAAEDRFRLFLDHDSARRGDDGAVASGAGPAVVEGFAGDGFEPPLHVGDRAAPLDAANEVQRTFALGPAGTAVGVIGKFPGGFPVQNMIEWHG